MPAIIFPDGTRLSGETWEGVERQLRADEWNPSDPVELRKEIAHRARVWSETEIPVESSSEQFFEDLERAGMVLIERPMTKTRLGWTSPARLLL